jgi:hypothetical protein
MRPEDLERLSAPYPVDGDRNTQFAEAIGAFVRAAAELYREVLGDLDADRLGVGWWAPHPGASRRILISDHLVLCASSVQTNLMEAKLHLLEFTDVSQQRSNLLADRIQVRAGQVVLTRPPVASARDELPMRLSGLHVAGFFRAVAGTLDCLGATIVGVAGLPTPMLTASFDRSRRALARPSASPIHVALGDRVERAISTVGPTGWLEWATDYRNMLVHRGRRTEMFQVRPIPAAIVDGAGQPIIRSDEIQQLPRDPGRSEVEVLLHSGNAMVLTEAARDTLEGIFASTFALVSEVSQELLRLWRRRRDEPDLVHQPPEQWAGGASDETTGFAGYRPGSEVYNPAALIGSPSIGPRFRAAALDDSRRADWANFD